jgi:hypothetical protein
MRPLAICLNILLLLFALGFTLDESALRGVNALERLLTLGLLWLAPVINIWALASRGVRATRGWLSETIKAKTLAQRLRATEIEEQLNKKRSRERDL